MSSLRLINARRLARVVVLLLAVEFLDELVFGVREAAWPVLRADLALSYVQIGVLLSAPNLFASLIEPAFGVWADRGHKWRIILAGGIAFAAACALVAGAPDFVWLLIAFALFAPASGAFVSIGQAALMDADPRRQEQRMAEWTLAGSFGVTAGPWILSAALAGGISWRWLFAALAGLSLVLVAVLGRARRATADRGLVEPEDGERTTDPDAAVETGRPGVVASLLRAFRRGVVWRWLILLQASDFMLDVLLGFLALYFVDVAGGTPAQGALAAAVFTTLGLIGDALVIPILKRVPGVRYLRWSAALMLPVYIAFLLAPAIPVKLVCLGLIGLLNAGWYAILKAQFYGAFPNQTGTAVAVDSAFGLIGDLAPLAIGLLAAWAGLGTAMWLLALGPVVVWLGTPHERGAGGTAHAHRA